MNIVRNLVVIAALVGAAFLFGRTADAQQDRRNPPKPPVWEYRDGANLTLVQLNAMGAEGWELSCVTLYGKDYYYILKRVRQQ